MVQNILPMMPLWLGGLIVLVICILGYEVGRLIYRRAIRNREPAESTRSDAEGYIIGSIFGLLAFIIGFTFSIAADRFNDRIGWVGKDATAITTMFLRAELLDEPFRTELRSTLREYAHTRIAPDGVWDEGIEHQLERSQTLRHKLWDEARNGAYPYRDSDLGAYILEGMNDMLTVGTRRELAGTAHIPDRILNALILYLFVASGVLGYLSVGQPNRVRIAAILLFALMALSIVLILDLDRPRSGSITVPQTALQNLVATLDQQIHLPAPAERPR